MNRFPFQKKRKGFDYLFWEIKAHTDERLWITQLNIPPGWWWSLRNHWVNRPRVYIKGYRLIDELDDVTTVSNSDTRESWVDVVCQQPPSACVCVWIEVGTCVCAGNVPSQKLHAHFVRVSSKVVVYSVRKGKKIKKFQVIFLLPGILTTTRRRKNKFFFLLPGFLRVLREGRNAGRMTSKNQNKNTTGMRERERIIFLSFSSSSSSSPWSTSRVKDGQTSLSHILFSLPVPPFFSFFF